MCVLRTADGSVWKRQERDMNTTWFEPCSCAATTTLCFAHRQEARPGIESEGDSVAEQEGL